MVVVLQNRNGAIDTGRIVKVTANKEGGVYVSCEHNDRDTLAKYSTTQMAKYAIEMYASALAGDERIFYFPKESEVKRLMSLEHSGQSSVHVKTKANRHGGS